MQAGSLAPILRRQPGDRPNILRALEGGRVRTIQLTHTALNLPHGIVSVCFQPGREIAFQRCQVRNATVQQRRTDHSDTGACHQELDYVNGIIHATRGRKIGLKFSVQHRYPTQRQTHLYRSTQQKVGRGLEIRRVKVRLVETVEQDQGIGATLLDELARDVGKRRKEGT